MAQTAQLIEMLKKALKAHGFTYADTARTLNLSEASVKRLFSHKSFSLQRLDQVCQMIDIEISDLVKMLNEDASAPISGLSLEQEQEIVADLELLLITVCVLNRWTMDEMVDYFDISAVRCIEHLARLDRLKMIELLPKNRVRLLVSSSFKWLENGPIQRFFLQKLQSDFFSSRFDQNSEQLIVLNGMLAASSFAVFQRKMEHLAREFDELSNDDAALPLQERDGTSVVLAMRPWRYGLFRQFKKKEAGSG
ncbi:MAG: helix-turn-helix transcriptional regulator [Candidatus Thiodiazotropha sp. (ex Lucinoma annulata)]|nr:helix-turn-helix transcriptional regulator [Candidatus Thiodiazotropha sp. (ex Lucinoma borealis)]MCU7885573.1 helix-turn-helix transcriptional regulator [Candidatus Thiodiazotropha sp. (ex Lucinoma annulata)]